MVALAGGEPVAVMQACAGTTPGRARSGGVADCPGLRGARTDMRPDDRSVVVDLAALISCGMCDVRAFAWTSRRVPVRVSIR